LKDTTGSWTVGNLGHTVTLSGLIDIVASGTATFTGSGTTIVSGTFASTPSSTLAISTVTTLQIGTTAILAANFTNDGSLVYNTAGNVTYTKVISGTGSVTQAGTGTLTFTGANTYSGTTTISAGTLQVGNGGATGALGSGDITDNATLAINRTGTVTLAQHISGTGAFKQSGTGTTILASDNTYGGTTTITAGTLQIGSGGTTGTLGSGAVTDSAALAFNRSDTLTVANAISGTGTLTQAGTGTTILTGANTYSGATTISAGALQIGNGGTTGALGTGAVVDSTALTFNRSNTLTVSSAISGAGTLTQAGPGTTILTGANTYGGTTTISAGTLQIGNGGTTGTLGTGAVTDNATLAFNHSDTLTISSAISGTGKIVQSGTGTLRLTTTNSFAGGSDINAGTLDIAAAGAVGTGQINFNAGAQTLALESAAFSAGNFANILTGFAAEDTIDLVGISASSASLGGGNVLSITTTGGTRTVHLDAAQSFAELMFQTSSDGAGGTLLKLVSIPSAQVNPWVNNTTAGHDTTVTVPSALGPGDATSGVDVLLYSIMQSLTVPTGIENVVLSGGGGRNTVTGTEANNRFTVASGDWSIDGRGGSDTIVYGHTRDAYAITANGNGYTVSGPDGTQSISNIETLIFSDKKIDLDRSADAALVYNVYQAALGRAADSAGEAYWLDWLHAGKSATDLAGQFVGSNECQSRFGTSSSNTQYVTALYTNVLHRAPDANGLGYWTGLLAKESRAQMLVDFAVSPENQAYAQVFIGQGVLVEHTLV
jgi:fibronectin-binding autotransporter adhesin